MLSNALDRISFWSFFIVVVLLPLFFIPFIGIPVEISKELLTVVGLVISIIFWAAARFSDGKINISRSSILFSGLGVVAITLLSAIFSSSPSVSFFGVMLDAGTFYFLLMCFLLLLMSSIILREAKNARIVLWGLIGSSILVILFQFARLFLPAILSFGVFGDKTDNLIGSWNAFGIFSGFVVIVAVYIIEFFPITKIIKWILAVLAFLSIIMVSLVNFTTIWVVLGIFSLIIFIYKISLHLSSKDKEEGKMKFPGYSFSVIMISLLFIMTGQFIRNYLPAKLGISNVEIRPSISATFSVAQKSLSQDLFFGIGPNKFSEAWARYKPEVINSTDFWDTSFNFGSGLIPTFVFTTGILGILAWLVFFITFIVTGVKTLFFAARNNIHKEISLFFVLALYLFVSSFLYSGGMILFMLAFILTGAFVGLYGASKQNGEFNFMFLTDPRKSFFSILLLVVIILMTAASGFKYVERLASISYFGKTVTANNINDAENSIIKAISLYKNDLYLRTYSQVYIAKANQFIVKGSGMSDAEKKELQVSIDQAVKGAQSATDYDKTSFVNWVSLGSIYQIVASLGVEGAYDKSIEAYTTASNLNPFNPGIKLSMASLSLSNNKIKEAKNYATEAISLKPDYVNALLILSQISKNEGNNGSAISYAEQALSFAPGNEQIVEYLASLKNSSSIINTKNTDTSTENKKKN